MSRRDGPEDLESELRKLNEERTKTAAEELAKTVDNRKSTAEKPERARKKGSDDYDSALNGCKGGGERGSGITAVGEKLSNAVTGMRCCCR